MLSLSQVSSENDKWGLDCSFFLVEDERQILDIVGSFYHKSCLVGRKGFGYKNSQR